MYLLEDQLGGRAYNEGNASLGKKNPSLLNYDL